MSITKSIQTAKLDLINLGYAVEDFDESKLLIKNYKLPSGWIHDTTDLLLVVPDGSSSLHGISIPNNLKTKDGISMPTNANPGYYQPGWTLFSFRLKPELDNEHYAKNHMDVVRKKLSVE